MEPDDQNGTAERQPSARPTPLRVLVVEDSASDEAVLLLQLRRIGYRVTHERVLTAETMRAALSRPWDIIISDYSMPHFDAPGALRILADSGLDIPLIIVSGTIGEDTAVEALQAGAKDFLVKGRLSRLRPAIERELKERASRAARRNAEQALLASEKRFRRLAESGVIGIVVSEMSGKILEANDAFLRMVGYSREELGRGCLRWDEMTAPEMQHTSENALAQLRSTGVAQPWEKSYVRKDGGRVPVLIGVAALDDRLTIAAVSDLSARKKAEAALAEAEAELRQIQRLEAIGGLASGVAHDFNNILSIIQGLSELMVTDLPAGDPMREDVEQIRDAARRASELTRQLLAFSRKQVLAPRVTQLDDVVCGIEKMMRRLVGSAIEIELRQGASVDPVTIDPGQIEQVILNLVANARDAMPEGGTLTIETANVAFDERHLEEQPGATLGPHVMLSFTDNGAGMDDATKRRMFEPFFTTKQVGKGTGLGLATVFGIVRQSGGTIAVSSKLGEGTAIRLYFPKSEGAPRSPERASDPPSHLQLSGRETILLVEDDEGVRRLARTILARYGYQVLEARSGGDALVVSEQHPAAIDLLVTDIIMPHMTGRQLAARLHQSRPGMRVLFTSGYTNNSILHDGLIDEDSAFLQKPLTPHALARKVRTVLDQAIRPIFRS